jgi:hypothetical protein
MWLKITSKINANRPAKNKLINQKKSRLKAEGLLDPPLKETGLRKPFVQYFQENGYENCFEWTKNDGIHFSSLWYPTLQSYGLNKRVSNNNIATLYESLTARIVHGNHFPEDLKPYELNLPASYTPTLK